VDTVKFYQTNKDTNELDLLAQKYGADKWGKHNYCPVYYDLFKDKRETKGYVVELGMGEGASLKMWNDFFPNSGIFGLDNELKRVKRFSDLTDIEVDEWPRISAQVCDQSSIKSLINFTNNVELLRETFLFVDDGSHRTSDQFLSAVVLVPFLKDETIYVIEDVHEPEELERMLNTNFEFSYDVKSIKCGDRYDDNLIIITK
jgi:hypothetical protein